MKKNFLQLVEALESLGVRKTLIQDVVDNIKNNKVDIIYWGDEGKESILHHAFSLAGAKGFLQDCLSIKTREQKIIEKYINEIDLHFSSHQWPLDFSQNDPVLLKQLWRQKNAEIRTLQSSSARTVQITDILMLKSESNRILRTLLKLPVVVVQGYYEPVITRDLVAALHREDNVFVRSVVDEELQVRYPDAYSFLSVLYGHRNVNKLNDLLDLKFIGSAGFLSSMIQTKEALLVLIDNLETARAFLGEEVFKKITAPWQSFEQLRLIGILNTHNSGVSFGRYQFDYPLEYSELHIPPWMKDSDAGLLSPSSRTNTGVYVLVFDDSMNIKPGSQNKNKLYEHYINIQENLIKPNYDALQLIVSHADKMTKMTAETVLMLLGRMVTTYQKIAPESDGDLVLEQYNYIYKELGDLWANLSEKDELPSALKARITTLKNAPLCEIDSAHSLIRYLHEVGNQALQKKIVSAKADLSIAIGNIASNDLKEIQLARLDDAPIIVNGLVRHRAIAAIIQASLRMSSAILGTFVVINNHIAFSMKLGEHRAEFSANIAHPDHEGFVRLQTYQGGIHIEQQLRSAFVERVLQEKGIAVTCEQEGLVDSLVSGILDKDHGARTTKQIEDAAILILRLVGVMRDLDYAMAYIFSQEILSKNHVDKIDRIHIDKIAHSFAEIFSLEGSIPFNYSGNGMPLATYCQYRGPSVLQEYKDYLANEQRMLRYRLFFSINGLLRVLDLPIIPSGKGGVGQSIIDQYFNKPIYRGLGRQELRINALGFVEKNPKYEPVREVINSIVSHENEALKMAVFISKTDLHLDFKVIGSVDQLVLVRAQLEVFPNEWLVIYGLVDEENRRNLYAFVKHLKLDQDQGWISVSGLRRLLRQSKFDTPGKIQVPGFHKTVSHRLLTGTPNELVTILGTSIRGLSASVGDGSARIGRITFDRSYYADEKTRERRILLVQFTTPEDLEAIRCAEAVLVTGGGLLSHTGVITREFAIPSMIIPHAEWRQSPEGIVVRLEERRPSNMKKTADGFWFSDSMISEIVEVREGDMVLVWASQGFISIMSMGENHLEQVHEIIHRIICGEKTTADLEQQLVRILCSISMQDNWEQIAADIISLILAETLWDRRVNYYTRKKLVDIVQRACSGALLDGKSIKLPDKSIGYINSMVQRLTGTALKELEGLLSEIEHNIAKVNVLWRALIIIGVAERHWDQIKILIYSLNLSNQRTQSIEERIGKLRHHPRVALLRATVVNEIESLAADELNEEHLPLLRQTLRRLDHKKNRGKGLTVLLVCTSNIDRSPLAEFLLKKMLVDAKISGVRVISRGVATTESLPMSEASQAVLLSEYSISATTHRSARVSEQDIEAADIILTMEAFHADLLKEKFSLAAHKIFLLSNYADVTEIGDIKDPAGQLEDIYHRVRHELQICLNNALKKMREDGLLAQAMVEDLEAKVDALVAAKRKRIAKLPHPVVPLEVVDADYVALVGGKAANLGEIARIVKQHGGTVPPAFMVTTFAFQRFLEENKMLDSYIKIVANIDKILENERLSHQNQYGEIAGLLEQVRNLIMRGQLDVENGVGREIMSAVQQCALQDSLLSVRSSGLQEDAEEASFAGAAETYLNISSGELLDAIKRVWISFWLIRGILYRHDRIVQQATTEPAVIVQKMFNSEVSGVIFTTDPVGDRDVIVIEAGYGLGEGVVSGLVDVDRYYVNKFDGSLINFHIGKKAFKIVQNPSGKGTCIEAVENDLRNVPCLSEEDINIEIAMALEEHYALSQDIEFGIENGKIAILQTRPVTTRG